MEELEKLSIGEENLRRRMKYYFKGLIILLFDDLEIQWNHRMEENEVGLEEEELKYFGSTISKIIQRYE